MSIIGERTTNLPAISAADEVLVNTQIDGVQRTGRMAVSALGSQIASGAGAITAKVVKSTFADLDAVKGSYQNGDVGLSLFDEDEEVRGQYALEGGEWVRKGDLPETVANAYAQEAKGYRDEALAVAPSTWETLRDQTLEAKSDAEAAAATGLGFAEAASDEADRAELARDASIVNAQTYADEATGRAAVANGETFDVQAAGQIASRRYRRISSTVSDLIATFPSVAAVRESDRKVRDLAHEMAIPALAPTPLFSSNVQLAFGSAIPGMAQIIGGFLATSDGVADQLQLPVDVANVASSFRLRVYERAAGGDVTSAPPIAADLLIHEGNQPASVVLQKADGAGSQVATLTLPRLVVRDGFYYLFEVTALDGSGDAVNITMRRYNNAENAGLDQILKGWVRTATAVTNGTAASTNGTNFRSAMEVRTIAEPDRARASRVSAIESALIPERKEVYSVDATELGTGRAGFVVYLPPSSDARLVDRMAFSMSGLDAAAYGLNLRIYRRNESTFDGASGDLDVGPDTSKGDEFVYEQLFAPGDGWAGTSPTQTVTLDFPLLELSEGYAWMIQVVAMSTVSATVEVGIPLAAGDAVFPVQNRGFRANVLPVPQFEGSAATATVDSGYTVAAELSYAGWAGVSGGGSGGGTTPTAVVAEVLPIVETTALELAGGGSKHIAIGSAGDVYVDPDTDVYVRASTAVGAADFARLDGTAYLRADEIPAGLNLGTTNGRGLTIEWWASISGDNTEADRPVFFTIGDTASGASLEVRFGPREAGTLYCGFRLTNDAGDVVIDYTDGLEEDVSAAFTREDGVLHGAIAFRLTNSGATDATASVWVNGVKFAYNRFASDTAGATNLQSGANAQIMRIGERTDGQIKFDGALYELRIYAEQLEHHHIVKNNGYGPLSIPADTPEPLARLSVTSKGDWVDPTEPELQADGVALATFDINANVTFGVDDYALATVLNAVRVRPEATKVIAQNATLGLDVYAPPEPATLVRCSRLEV
tara:strand:- start:19241 stop:22234 length:2994 start_codon:yes stop_codon:yes gene_type:complete